MLVLQGVMVLHEESRFIGPALAQRITRARSSRGRRPLRSSRLASWHEPLPPRSDPLEYVPSRCSNLIEECFTEVLLLCGQCNSLHEMSLPKRAGDPQALSDVSDSDGTETGARQAIEVTTNSAEALGTASPP